MRRRTRAVTAIAAYCAIGTVFWIVYGHGQIGDLLMIPLWPLSLLGLLWWIALSWFVPRPA
jgi:hypothetical protein